MRLLLVELWFLQQNLLFLLQEEDEEEDGEEDEEDEAEEGELSPNNPVSCSALSKVKCLVFLELPQPQCRAVVAAAFLPKLVLSSDIIRGHTGRERGLRIPKFQPCQVILGNVRGQLLRKAVLGTDGPCRRGEGISWGHIQVISLDLSLGQGSSGCNKPRWKLTEYCGWCEFKQSWKSHGMVKVGKSF